MIVNVIATPNFQREAKKLIKKYRTLKGELADLISELEQEPKTGTLITENVYKIRLAVKSKGKGKSGGMRIITYVEAELVQTEDTTDVYLLSIYDKSNYENVSEALLKSLVEDIQEELLEEMEDEEKEDNAEDNSKNENE
jgi:mRNA-degrading endonuclease RelE of RelBE toxin-antitoxin system